MGDFFPDPRSIPLYARCADLFEELFPPARYRTIALAWRAPKQPGENRLVMRRPSTLLRQLRGVRSDHQLERFLVQWASLKELASIHFQVILFLNELGQLHVDSRHFQKARLLLGRSPNKLRLVRAALRFWRDAE